MRDYLPLLGVLFALLLGLIVGKAWERYKLRDGRWIDRRRLRETPHYMLGLNFLVDNQVDQAIDELTQAASTGTDALDFRHGGFVDRALEAFQEVVRLDPRNRYALVNLQKLYEEQDQWGDALRVRREIAKLDGGRRPDDRQILAFLTNEIGSARERN